MNKTPLKIGKHVFENNFIQAPLAGISTAPFRLLTHQTSQPAYTCTEMMSCKTLLHAPDFSKRRYTTLLPGEGPVCFQLSGHDAKELGEATKIAEDAGAAIIDLNCGCPVKKIRGKGAGSKILSDPKNLFHLIHAMKSNTNLPVTIKIRVQSQFDDFLNHELVKVINDSGVDALTVHGRHWREHYETPVNHNEIAYFVNEVNIPVIGNGDIVCIETLKNMLATNCAGVMIGRALVGKPWLINQLQHELNNRVFHLPNITQMANMLLTHIHGLISLLQNEKFAIYETRQFAKYYARYMKEKIAFTEAIYKTESLSEMELLIKQYFI